MRRVPSLLILILLTFSSSLFANGGIEMSLSGLTYSASVENRDPDTDGVDDYKNKSAAADAAVWDLEIALKKNDWALYLYPSIPIAGSGAAGGVGFGYLVAPVIEVGFVHHMAISKEEGGTKGNRSEEETSSRQSTVYLGYTIATSVAEVELRPLITVAQEKRRFEYGTTSTQTTNSAGLGFAVTGSMPVTDAWFYEAGLHINLAKGTYKTEDSSGPNLEEKISSTTLTLTPLAVRFVL